MFMSKKYETVKFLGIWLGVIACGYILGHVFFSSQVAEDKRATNEYEAVLEELKEFDKYNAGHGAYDFPDNETAQRYLELMKRRFVLEGANSAIQYLTLPPEELPPNIYGFTLPVNETISVKGYSLEEGNVIGHTDNIPIVYITEGNKHQLIQAFIKKYKEETISEVDWDGLVALALCRYQNELYLWECYGDMVGKDGSFNIRDNGPIWKAEGRCFINSEGGRILQMNGSHTWSEIFSSIEESSSVIDLKLDDWWAMCLRQTIEHSDEEGVQ